MSDPEYVDDEGREVDVDGNELYPAVEDEPFNDDDEENSDADT